MKVIIGPYKSWFGPYQLADKIVFWQKDTDDCVWANRAQKLGDFFAHGFGDENHETWFYKLCNWIDKRRSRHIYVRIDKWDTWSMDHTLAYIITPMLKQLNATKHGAPQVDDSDVPDELKSINSTLGEHEHDVDSNHFKRWDWVMQEMIWAFEQQTKDDDTDQFYTHPKERFKSLQEMIENIKVDREGLDKHQARKANGFRLFGKYYQGLWD